MDIMSMDSHSFDHIARLLASKKPINNILEIYSASKLIHFCRVAATWIRLEAPTPINAKILYAELEEKFSIEEYPELWI